MTVIALLLLAEAMAALPAVAQERPCFVTYSHETEEPGNLDTDIFNALGKQFLGMFRGGN